MSRSDKVIALCFLLGTLVFVGYGLYLVGNNGVILLVGAMLFYFITEVFRTAEIEMVTEGLEKKKVIHRPEREVGTEAVNLTQEAKVGASANDNNDLIRNIIDKKKRNPQQNLLAGMMGNPAPVEQDAEQARIDHEILVAHFEKKEADMRSAPTAATVDENVQQKIIEKQKAYVDTLMEPAIVPQ